MTSYQANFSSHYTSNRHDSFLLEWHGIGKYNKMFRSFYLVHSTTLSYNSVTKILVSTNGRNFKSFCEVNQNLNVICRFSPYRVIQIENQAGGGANLSRIGVYRVVQTLYCVQILWTLQQRRMIYARSRGLAWMMSIKYRQNCYALLLFKNND